MPEIGFIFPEMTGTTIDALKEIDASQLATKSDLKEAIADLKVDIVRWLVVTQIASAGFILAAMKFVNKRAS